MPTGGTRACRCTNDVLWETPTVPSTPMPTGGTRACHCTNDGLFEKSTVPSALHAHRWHTHTGRGSQRISLCTGLDHSTLSIKKRGKHIRANQHLYIHESKSGKVSFIAGWCYEPSQPHRVISGLISLREQCVYTDFPDVRAELTVRLDWFILSLPVKLKLR